MCRPFGTSCRKPWKGERAWATAEAVGNGSGTGQALERRHFGRFSPGHHGLTAVEATLDTRFIGSYPKHMEVYLTPDQLAFVRQAIESGRLQREEDVVKEALSLWEERERTRSEILAAVDEAEASFADGHGRPITQESMRELAEDVKRRGRARLAAERQTPR